MENELSSAPVVYANEEEILSLVKHADGSAVSGTFCEWEGENVVHLHVKSPRHAYGRTGECRFLNTEASSLDPAATAGCEWIATWHVCQDSNVPAFRAFRRNADGKYKAVPSAFIPSREQLHSRSHGILEDGTLSGRRVAIVGLGSFGSQIAVELAKAGVGEFSLFDFDRVELHNLMRHTCTVQDLGRLKTDAISDAILGKNPYAVVDKFPVDVNKSRDTLAREVERSDLVICATDNNQSRFTLQGILLKAAKTCIFGRAVTRAEGGDVFRYRPGGPCYCCLIGNGWYNAHAEEITNEESARRNGRIAAYVSPEDAAAVVQVGLSADISPICNFMVKLSLVELARGTASALQSLDAELVHDYWMWANRRERQYANWGAFSESAAKPTILRWYGARIPKNTACAYCAEHPAASVLDTGDDLDTTLVGNDTGTSDIDLNRLGES